MEASQHLVVFEKRSSLRARGAGESSNILTPKSAARSRRRSRSDGKVQSRGRQCEARVFIRGPRDLQLLPPRGAGQS